MKKWKKVLLITLPATLFLSFQAFAGQWKSDMNGWWYQEDDGSYLTNGWYWLDGNGDGTAECYYFGKDGYLVKEHGYADGYYVDENGAWMVDGKVQTKQVEKTAADSGGNGGAGADAGIADTGSAQSTDITGISDPSVLYQIASEKTNNLDQVDGKVEMTISESAYGVTITMSMDNSFKMKGVQSGNLQFVSTGTIAALGMNVPISEFYTDGYYYENSSARKYREPMTPEEALDETIFYGSYLMDEDEMGYSGVFSLRQEGENKVLYLDTNSDIFREELGFEDSEDTQYQIHSATLELVINPDGYCIAQRVSIDVDEIEYNSYYGTSVTTNRKMYVLVTINNPGQPVDVKIPSTEGYEEIYALR